MYSVFYQNRIRFQDFTNTHIIIIIMIIIQQINEISLLTIIWWIFSFQKYVEPHYNLALWICFKSNFIKINYVYKYLFYNYKSFKKVWTESFKE